MKNEKAKTTIILMTAFIFAMQAYTTINTGIQYNKLKQEIKNIRNSQELVLDSTSDIHCDQKNSAIQQEVITHEYDIKLNMKPVNANVSLNAKNIANKIAISYYDVPACDTSFKAYMDYRCITDDTTKQWEIQQNAWTDNDGFRRTENDYIVAMGTYYTSECGDRFKIIFESGSEITVTVGDIKQDCHTDYFNQYTPVYDENGAFVSGNVLEFIVDTDVLAEMSQVLGTVGHHDYLNGNIKTIERIGN